MSIGYPVGAVLGGLVAAQLLRGNDWRSVFYFGAGVTAVLIPVVYFVVPESVHWLARRQPKGALERINAALGRMGFAAVSALPDIPAASRKGSSAELFAPGTRGDHHDRHARVLLPHHDLLLHREMDPEDRRRSGLHAVGGRRCARLDERRRRARRRRVRHPDAEVQPQGADHCPAGPLDGRGHIVWTESGRPAGGSRSSAPSPGSAPTRESSGCTQSSPRCFPHRYARLEQASRLVSDAAARSSRRSSPASCSPRATCCRRCR